ncbi:hypothetical protein CEXT_84911, partial [Caerostris extrusa]
MGEEVKRSEQVECNRGHYLEGFIGHLVFGPDAPALCE